MPARSPSLRRASAAAGQAARSGDPAAIAVTRSDLAVERITAYVEKVTAVSPPLSAEQRDRLVSLLRPSEAV